MIKQLMAGVIAFTLAAPVLPAGAKGFVLPHVLEKKQSPSVGIKEEGVKRQAKQKKFLPGNFKKAADKATPKLYTKVKSPRDAATGQASGKRMHKPMPIKSTLQRVNTSRSNIKQRVKPNSAKTNLNSSRSNKTNLNSSKSNRVKSKSNITNNRQR